MARKHIPFAIAYDFDGTLAPGNMQEYDFVPALNMKSGEFWKKAKALAKEHQADEILSYMHLMIDGARTAQVPVRKENFRNFGKGIDLFPGVKDWFKRINEYGRSNEVKIDHFIISSGLREMVEGTPIARHFRCIYASAFMYDHNDVAHWPALAVNYTNKTQYLFRINKGSLDVHDHSEINKYVPHDERPVPFRNMVFIGDGETDVPSMRLVKEQGGHSIAVYEQGKRGMKQIAVQHVKDGRANLAAKADYSEGSSIDAAVKAMIDKAVANRAIRESGAKLSPSESKSSNS